MNAKELGYEEPSSEILYQKAQKIQEETKAPLSVIVDELREEYKDQWLLDYQKEHGGFEIGVCFNKIAGYLLNAAGQLRSDMILSPTVKSDVVRRSVFRTFHSPNEVDAYLQALDDANLPYIKLNEGAIKILKSLNPSDYVKL